MSTDWAFVDIQFSTVEVLTARLTKTGIEFVLNADSKQRTGCSSLTVYNDQVGNDGRAVGLVPGVYIAGYRHKTCSIFGNPRIALIPTGAGITLEDVTGFITRLRIASDNLLRTQRPSLAIEGYINEALASGVIRSIPVCDLKGATDTNTSSEDELDRLFSVVYKSGVARYAPTSRFQIAYYYMLVTLDIASLGYPEAYPTWSPGSEEHASEITMMRRYMAWSIDHAMKQYGCN